MSESRKILCLFDVDGTLTKSRQEIDEDMFHFIKTRVIPKYAVGLVGGSDISKITEQMGGGRFSLLDFDYIFSENGLLAFKNGCEIGKQSLSNFLGEEKTQRLINFALRYMSELTLPLKRGTFIEYRTGMINLCPIGRSCSQEERMSFVDIDKKHKIREKFVASLKENLDDLGLQFSIGGQISIDVFPKGWDKTYCLQFVENEFKGQIHFFGDRVELGENDYEIYTDSRVIGHRVTSPEDTKNQLKSMFGL